ncbi:NAD(+) diphosphatase [Desulfosporosinus sp. Sb-LF]|uniref:NAD(+) diphosphatase n=1 Tax=Desulfosporosinus sp. Sb-LF TaxID=2560027 RepID=UPI00107FC40A|nr:NAD(+) diphosphatase [Desulfosporosinus sp. Sb-LF]TGE33417.1 NAD(+) diphosphatase [Desulfosporosinus sp. Sb-LF]
MYFEPELSYKIERDARAYWLLFKGNKILIQKDKVQFTLPEINLYNLRKKLNRSQYLDRREGHSFYVSELTPDTVAPEGMSFYDLRRLLGQIPENLFFLAGKAHHILHWDRTHQYCSRCGAHTENKIDERAKICPSCGFVNYPRISPAMIVAITRGREILLAKGGRFQDGFYSVLAGFVEPGETFEECVQREVEEEVGLKVNNIKYFGSQPWPFPDSIMVGFTAEYASGDIIIDKKEILDAGWFTVEQLPLIPCIGSIARRLIDWFITKELQVGNETQTR